MKDTRKPRTLKVLGTLEKEEYQEIQNIQVFGTLPIAQKSRFFQSAVGQSFGETKTSGNESNCSVRLIFYSVKYSDIRVFHEEEGSRPRSRGLLLPISL